MNQENRIVLAHEILELFAYATKQGSYEPLYMLNFSRPTLWHTGWVYYLHNITMSMWLISDHCYSLHFLIYWAIHNGYPCPTTSLTGFNGSFLSLAYHFWIRWGCLCEFCMYPKMFGQRLLHIFKCISDQILSLKQKLWALIWIHIVCKIGYLRT